MTKDPGTREGPGSHGTAGDAPRAVSPERPEPPAVASHTDRLRLLDTATRRIARGMDVDETLTELVGAAIPEFTDSAYVYLRDPLPADDEPSGMLRAPGVLRRYGGGGAGGGPPGAGGSGGAAAEDTGRTPAGDTVGKPTGDVADTGPAPCPIAPDIPIAPNTPITPGILTTPDTPITPGSPTAPEILRPAPDGRLAQLLEAGHPVFGDTPENAPAVDELLSASATTRTPALTIPPGRRLIIAPLHGRTTVMGGIVLIRDPARPAFTTDDLLVASQLATLTALGVDKAVLYGRDASVMNALQRTMLPPSLPEPTGVRLASRYLPASKTARVGGDWYDAIPLPGNRVALVIGDVMGHSVTSAAIMGQLRTIVQTLAGLDLPPDEVLHHLDEQAERLGSQHMATCVYGLYDPVLQRLLLANAGHPPPLLLHPDGRAEILRLPPGAPIGVGSGAFETTELPAPAGATLLLYTDGLVESRGSDVLTGVEDLLARLRTAGRRDTGTRGGAPPPLETLCDEALGRLGAADRDDDVALLAARFVGILPETVAYWYLAPHPQTAGQARRLTRRTLHRWNLDALLETTELLVSEVVANAVRYATRPITLRLLRTDVLRCEVGDDSALIPRMRHAQPSDEGGRGLFLVDQLACRWGATRLSTGKVVWFELEPPDDLQLD